MIYPVQQSSNVKCRALVGRLVAITGWLLWTAGAFETSAAEPAYTLLAYNSVSSIFNPLAVKHLPPAEVKATVSLPEPARFQASMTLASDESAFDEDAEAQSGERYFAEVTRGGRDGVFGSGSVMLLRTRLPTRFSYASWAGLHSGYGQIFSSPDTIGRSRINGAGLNDPACLYLKMSFNF